jgi:hypothetical protein
MKKLLLHKTSRDTAIEILSKQENGKYLVAFYNINLTRITGARRPIFLGYGEIHLQPISEYFILDY